MNHRPSNEKELPRSLRPPIPEPLHRVAPKGISSGISFRNLPTASFNAIRKICNHYEAKCSGTYDSLASRYVVQMAREVRCQIDCMQGLDPSSIPHYIPEDDTGSCSDPLDNVDLDEEEDNLLRRRRRQDDKIRKPISVKPRRPNTATDIPYYRRNYNTSLNEQNQKLKKELITIKKEMQRLQQSLSEQKDAYEEKLLTSVNEEQEKTRSQISQVKEDARIVIDFIRRKADEFIAENDVKHDVQMKDMENKMNSMERKMKSQFHNQLEKFELKFKDSLQREQAKVKEYNFSPKLSRKKPISLSPPRRRERTPRSKSPPPKYHVVDLPPEKKDFSFNDESFRKDPEVVGDDGSDKERSSMDECLWLRSRVSELEQWSDTLIKALQDGAKLKGIKGQFFAYQDENNGQQTDEMSSQRSKSCKAGQEQKSKLDLVPPSPPRVKKRVPAVVKRWR